MMVVWWAAFFVCGLVFPAGACDAAAVVSAAAAALLADLGGGRISPAWLPGVRNRALFAVAIIGGVILWQTAGAARTAHDIAAAGAGRGAGTGARSSFSAGMGPLSLPAARRFLCARLNDGRLSSRSRGFVAALVLGERSGLTARLREEYSFLGIAHFLALSGLHLGVIAAPLAKGLAIAVRPPWIRHATLFALLSLYASVACFPPSLVRALAMGAAAAAARSAGIGGDLAGALVAGSFAAAVLDPAIVFEAGFQLSFAAVMGIAVFGLPATKALDSRLVRGPLGNAVRALMYPAVISACVQIFSMPLAVALFGRAPILSPIANAVFALPFTALLYASALYVFCPIGAVRGLLAPGINPLCRALEAVPGALARCPQPHVVAGDANWILYGIAIAAAAFALRSRRRTRRSLAALSAAIGAISFCMPAGGSGGPVCDSAGSARAGAVSPFLHGPGFIYVERAGGALFLGESFDAPASRDLAKTLWRRGSRRIGRVVILPGRLPKRHGLFPLAGRMAIGEVFCSPYLSAGNGAFLDDLAARGARIRVASGRLRLEAPGFAVEITAPPFPPPRGAPLAAREAHLSCRLIAPPSDSAGYPRRLEPDRRGDGRVP